MFGENVFISWNFMVSHVSDMAIEPLVKYVTNNISLEAFVLTLLNSREKPSNMNMGNGRNPVLSTLVANTITPNIFQKCTQSNELKKEIKSTLLNTGRSYTTCKHF